MENRVVITGLGVVSPVGNNVTDFWNSLVEGKCGIDLIKGFEEYELPVSVAGQVKDFNPEADGLERNDIRRNDKFCIFALAAAAQAMTIKLVGQIRLEKPSPNWKIKTAI
jgi:3-oxoacyl-[acyl-carrier-protein] synthase II